MNYLIDTNIISEVRKGSRCDANVAQWYARVADDSLYLSVLVVGEIRKGIEKCRPRDPERAHIIEKWLGDISKSFADRILPVDRAAADEWGRLNAIRPLPVVDGLLAATAKTLKMTLVTRNIPDVANLGVRVLNPFERNPY